MKVSIDQSTLLDVILLLCESKTSKTLEFVDRSNEVILEILLDADHFFSLTAKFDSLQEAANFNRRCVIALNRDPYGEEGRNV